MRLARDGYADYSRKADTGEYAGLGKHDKFSALLALSSDLGARFPEAKADGYFHVHIPRYSTMP